MTLGEMIFVAIWIILLIFSLCCVAKAKNQKGKSYLYIAVIVFPFIGPLLAIMILHSSSKLFWQNSATKDEVWMAETNIDSSTNGDSE